MEKLSPRMEGLERTRKLVGDNVVDHLTRENPRQLLPADYFGTNGPVTAS
jgi:hypothetical protein